MSCRVGNARRLVKIRRAGIHTGASVGQGPRSRDKQRACEAGVRGEGRQRERRDGGQGGAWAASLLELVCAKRLHRDARGQRRRLPVSSGKEGDGLQGVTEAVTYENKEGRPPQATEWA